MQNLLLMLFCATQLQAATSLTVLSDPAGVVVLLDGREAGTTPVTIEFDRGGRHKVALRKDGYEELMAIVEIKTGEEKKISFSFVSKQGISPISGVSNKVWDGYISRRKSASGLIKTGGYVALGGAAVMLIGAASGAGGEYVGTGGANGAALLGFGLIAVGGGIAIVGSVLKPSPPRVKSAFDMILEIQAPALATEFKFKNLSGPKFQKLFTFNW